MLRPLSDGVRMPRAEREKAAHELLEGYVSMLEQWCLRFPWQWFNFYDFWSGGAPGPDFASPGLSSPGFSSRQDRE